MPWKHPFQKIVMKDGCWGWQCFEGHVWDWSEGGWPILWRYRRYFWRSLLYPCMWLRFVPYQYRGQHSHCLLQRDRYDWSVHQLLTSINLSRISAIFAPGMQHTLVLVNLFGSILRTRLLPKTKESFGVLGVGKRSVKFDLRAVISYSKSMLRWRNVSFSVWKFWHFSFKSLISVILSFIILLMKCVNRSIESRIYFTLWGKTRHSKHGHAWPLISSSGRFKHLTCRAHDNAEHIRNTGYVFRLPHWENYSPQCRYEPFWGLGDVLLIGLLTVCSSETSGISSCRSPGSSDFSEATVFGPIWSDPYDLENHQDTGDFWTMMVNQDSNTMALASSNHQHVSGLILGWCQHWLGSNLESRHTNM